MNDFTLGLALYDFVPVILTGIAVYYVAGMVRVLGVPMSKFAYLGAVLVFAAGVSKATWKLNATLTGQDLDWLANLLFPLMAPGFALLAAGIWGAGRALREKTSPGWLWLVPMVAICIAFATAAYRLSADIERGWFLPIMTLTSLSNIVLTILLFTMAWRQGQRILAALFTVNLAMVFALIPIAQMESFSIAMHWFEQTLTAIGAAAFAYAAYRFFHSLFPFHRPSSSA